MTAYRQIIIPEVNSGHWENFKSSELRKKVLDYYKKNYQQKTHIKNIDKGITIEFIGDGGRRISYGGPIYINKACIIEILPDIVKYAKFTNYKNRKETDKSTVVGYFNFKIKVKITGKIEILKLAIQLRKDGKFYYNHDIMLWKNKRR